MVMSASVQNTWAVVMHLCTGAACTILKPCVTCSGCCRCELRSCVLSCYSVYCLCHVTQCIAQERLQNAVCTSSLQSCAIHVPLPASLLETDMLTSSGDTSFSVKSIQPWLRAWSASMVRLRCHQFRLSVMMVAAPVCC